MQQSSLGEIGRPQSVFSKHKYVEYIPGTLNVILSVPHGGRLRPNCLPNRDHGSMVNGTVVFDHHLPKDPHVVVRTKADRFTIPLALDVAFALHEKTGRWPHVVMNRLHRIKLDCNCDLPEATFNVPEAVEAWKSYHRFVEMSKSAIDGVGLFIDIHGQCHPEGWVELGYTISRENLNSGLYEACDSSVRHLHGRLEAAHGSRVDIRELLCGASSLGGLMMASHCAYSVAVVPSPQHPGPGSGQYYSGGYNVARHGSKFSGQIDGIQIESPLNCRVDVNRNKYADLLASGIAAFLKHYY